MNKALAIPLRYRLSEHIAQFQNLIQWPARNIADAWANEMVRRLADQTRGLSLTSIGALERLNRIQALPLEERRAMVFGALAEIPVDSELHPLAWMHKDQSTGCYGTPAALAGLDGPVCRIDASDLGDAAPQESTSAVEQPGLGA
ncbi:hypothetical protein KBW71_00775 [Hydrogenophaga aromaticivorans]|uniref:hypothetical protein n=1 Tax=Hydrogenophaga aromaticivorans TaxID=2610898 RepID=UPI001B367657|nr:hypothetical protein [Hydrogenophaga aromaticivorans]MBQ0916985.1 hypothetical protein [Hydrogenophaga aromaticivorans]